MTNEIFITKKDGYESAMLIVDNCNVASINGNHITIAVNCKSGINTDVFAYNGNEITGQFNNLKPDCIINDVRTEIEQFQSKHNL